MAILVRSATLGLLLSTSAVPLLAQGTACPASPHPPGRYSYDATAANLPIDRAIDLLALSPGASSLIRGELSVRGAGKGVNGLYIDGVPVLAGRRNHLSPALGGSRSGDVGSGIPIATNGFTELRLHTGLTSVELGNASGGIIEVETAPCAAASTLRASVASDAFLGADHGIGLNRLTLNGAGQFGRLTLGVSAMAEGQRTMLLGQGQNNPPVFIADGVDTTVSFEQDGVPRSVDIARFKASEGIRIPSSASTIYSAGAHLRYQPSDRHQLSLSAITGQRQGRAFDYQGLYNPRQAFADRVSSQVITAGWHGLLRQSEALRLSADAYLSLQRDQETNGPLSSDGERTSRDPAGLMLAPLDFRFDRSNFAVNQALVDNFRTNTGRRAPYDLDNTSPFALVDEYRNNPYALLGWSEGGGPAGVLTLYHERRLVGKGVVSAERGRHHRLRVGAELTRYDVEFYSASLTAQTGSEAYVESPTLTTLFADYRLTSGEATITGGVRLDRFASGASRPEFPRISSRPGFDPADPDAGFIRDESHSRVSPRVTAEFRATPALQLYAGVTALAQVPDFTDLYRGLNTDLAVTSPAQTYGADLDFVTSTLLEGGLRYTLDSATSITGSLWNRRDRNIVVTRLRSEFDPLTLSQVDINRSVNGGSGRATGVDLRVTRTLGPRGQAWLSYGLATVDSMVRGGTRNHNVAATLMYHTGDLRILGGALRKVGVYAIGRVQSGTAFTRCTGGLTEESGVVSDTVRCHFYVGNFNSARTPTITNLDLRLTRTIDIGKASLVLFGDVRNLLNTRNVIRVFAQGGRTRNAIDRDQFLGGALESWANEGTENGVRGGDGTLDLTFGGGPDPRSACGNWTAGGVNRTPNCVYLIEAERRFGNGDHEFTLAEQERAFNAYYYVARGEQHFTAPGRRVRFGMEVHL